MKRIILWIAILSFSFLSCNLPAAAPTRNEIMLEEIIVGNGISTTSIYKFVDKSNGVTCYLLSNSQGISCLKLDPERGEQK